MYKSLYVHIRVKQNDQNERAKKEEIDHFRERYRKNERLLLFLLENLFLKNFAGDLGVRLREN